MSIGVPVKILHESEHHIVTIELKTGDQFMGYLAEAEDTMNCRLDDVTMTNRSGKQVTLDQVQYIKPEQKFQVYLRGSQIRFIVIPTFFKNAPMFKRLRAQVKGKNKQQMREKSRKARELLKQTNKKSHQLV